MVDLRGRLANPDVQRTIERLIEVLAQAESSTERRATVSRSRPHKLAHRLNSDAIGQLLQDYQQGATIKDLVARYAISKTSVLSLLHAHGVPLRAHRRLTEEEVDEAAALYRAGWSLVKIGQQLGVDDETIRGRLHRAGVTMRGCHERIRP
jgi:hypothetical protein